MGLGSFFEVFSSLVHHSFPWWPRMSFSYLFAYDVCDLSLCHILDIYNMRFSRYIAQMKWCIASDACIRKRLHYFICIACLHATERIEDSWGAMYLLIHASQCKHPTAWAVIRTGNLFQTLITGQASYSNSTSLLIQVSVPIHRMSLVLF